MTYRLPVTPHRPDRPGAAAEVLLGTVAIEPNRWGTIRPDRSPQTRVGNWLGRIAALPVDGLELWEGHLTRVDPEEVAAILDGPLPIRILNSYVDFDAEDPSDRAEAAAWVERSGARGVKFNVGADPAAEGAYAERIAAWLDDLPPAVSAICECHVGVSITEDPATAARVFAAAGPPSRVQALVHTHDPPRLLAEKFDAFGDRITHVHVNHLDPSTMVHPRLSEVADELGATVELLGRLGFEGSWTLEFVAGLLTSRDHPAALIDQAADDLDVLHRLLS